MDVTRNILNATSVPQQLCAAHEGTTWLLEEHRKALSELIAVVDARFQDFIQRSGEQIRDLENRVGSFSSQVGSLRRELEEYSQRDDRVRALFSKRRVWFYVRALQFWKLL